MQCLLFVPPLCVEFCLEFAAIGLLAFAIQVHVRSYQTIGHLPCDGLFDAPF